MDEHPDRFQWEHASSRAAFGPVNGYSLFRGVVANTVELRFSAELFERRGVVLVCSHVQVTQCEGQGAAVNQDILENIGVLASDGIR